MSPTVKNVVMLVVIVGALVAAGFFFFTRGKKETTYPKTGFETQWICEKCGKHYELSPAQYKEWLDSPDRRRRDPNYPANLVVFWCDDCKTFSVVRARIDASGNWVITQDSEGRRIQTEAAQPTGRKGAAGPKKSESENPEQK